jgi:hypothetical protein
MTTRKTSKDVVKSLQDYDFHPFILERKALEKWYIPAFAPYIIAKLLAIPLYLSSKRPWFLDSHEDIIYLSVPVILSIIVLLYNAWAKQIPDVFLKLKNHLSKPRTGDSIKKKYDEFLEKYLNELHSPYRYLFIVALILSVCQFLADLINTGGDIRSQSDAPFFFVVAYNVMFYIISPIIWTYFAAVGIWIMSVTGRYLWKLPREFEITVEPRHPDKCGGLSFLGIFCLGFSYPILVGTIFLAILGLTGGIILLQVSSPISNGATFFLIFVAMPFLYISFFAPLWGIHKEMEMRRAEFLETGALYIKQLETKVNESIQKKDFTNVKTLSSELDSLVSYYSGDLPVWPFDKNIVLKFLSPQIVPVLGIVFKLETLTQSNLTAFLNYLFPAK